MYRYYQYYHQYTASAIAHGYKRNFYAGLLRTPSAASARRYRLIFSRLITSRRVFVRLKNSSNYDVWSSHQYDDTPRGTRRIRFNVVCVCVCVFPFKKRKNQVILWFHIFIIHFPYRFVFLLIHFAKLDIFIRPLNLSLEGRFIPVLSKLWGKAIGNAGVLSKIVIVRFFFCNFLNPISELNVLTLSTQFSKK